MRVDQARPHSPHSPISAGPTAEKPATSANDLRFNIVETGEALETLTTPWNELFARIAKPHQVFQTHGFVKLWVNNARELITPTANRRCDCRLVIATAYRSERLVLVWPLIISNRFGLHILATLGDPIAQYSDALVDPAETVIDLLAAALDQIRRKHRIDLLKLRKVRADATIAPFLAAKGSKPYNPVVAPYVILRAGGSAFEDRQSSKAKKNRRRLRHRLEEQGEVAFQTLSATPEAATAAIEALAIKRDWLQRRGLLSPAITDDRLDSFLAAAASTQAQSTGCRLFTIKRDQLTVAVAIGFECKRQLMLYLITQTADVERFGAGVLNLEHTLRIVESEQFEAVDLLPPGAAYKSDWTNKSVDVSDHAIAMTLSGWLWSHAYERFAKPRLKQALEAIPHSFRHRIFPTTKPG